VPGHFDADLPRGLFVGRDLRNRMLPKHVVTALFEPVLHVAAVLPGSIGDDELQTSLHRGRDLGTLTRAAARGCWFGREGKAGQEERE